MATSLISEIRLTGIRTRRATDHAAALSWHDHFVVVALAGLVAIANGLAWLPLRWVQGLFGVAAYVLAALSLLSIMKKQRSWQPTSLVVALSALPAVGMLQLLLHISAYRFATVQAILYWGSLAAIAISASCTLANRSARDKLTLYLLTVAAFVTTLELVQIFTIGRYGLTSTGYPLLSSNQYSELAELLLPVAVVRAVRHRTYRWPSVMLATVMVATVVASGSRMGSVLVAFELLLLAASPIVRKSAAGAGARLLVPVIVSLSLGFTALEGPTTFLHRLGMTDPLAGRSEIARAASGMLAARPWLGYGLGNFSVVYPQFASFDNGYFINHAHNDWLELATEAGIVVSGLLFISWLISFPRYWQHPWALGVFAIGLHACVDFPLQRFGVTSLLIILAGAVFSNRHILPPP